MTAILIKLDLLVIPFLKCVASVWTVCADVFMTAADVAKFSKEMLVHLKSSRPTAVNLFNMADLYVCPLFES